MDLLAPHLDDGLPLPASTGELTLDVRPRSIVPGGGYLVPAVAVLPGDERGFTRLGLFPRDSPRRLTRLVV